MHIVEQCTGKHETNSEHKRIVPVRCIEQCTGKHETNMKLANSTPAALPSSSLVMITRVQSATAA